MPQAPAPQDVVLALCLEGAKCNYAGWTSASVYRDCVIEFVYTHGLQVFQTPSTPSGLPSSPHVPYIG